MCLELDAVQAFEFRLYSVSDNSREIFDGSFHKFRKIIARVIKQTITIVMSNAEIYHGTEQQTQVFLSHFFHQIMAVNHACSNCKRSGLGLSIEQFEKERLKGKHNNAYYGIGKIPRSCSHVLLCGCCERYLLEKS